MTSQTPRNKEKSLVHFGNRDCIVACRIPAVEVRQPNKTAATEKPDNAKQPEQKAALTVTVVQPESKTGNRHSPQMATSHGKSGDWQ